MQHFFNWTNIVPTGAFFKNVFVYLTCKQQISSGMWAMMTLLEVFDWSFSDSFVHKFSAPDKKKKNTSQEAEKVRRVEQNKCIQPLRSNDAWTQHSSPWYDYLARLWRPTPWGPRRRRWLDNEAWGGSVLRPASPCRAAPAAAPTDCCWTAPGRSRELLAQTPAAHLEGERDTLTAFYLCLTTEIKIVV